MRPIKIYLKEKNKKKDFNSHWETLLNDILLPLSVRVLPNLISNDIIPVQPLSEPNGLISYYDNNNFPLWKIKIIFNKQI